MRDHESHRRFVRIASLDALRIRREVDDELRFHLDMRVAELRAAGLSEEQARAQALLRFGDLRGAREYCHMMDTRALREERRRDWLADAWYDLRWSLRQMRRAPAFTLLAVLTLGVGMGAATAIFSVVHRLLIDPIPVEGGDRIVALVRRSPGSGLTLTPSVELLQAWRSGVTAFDAVGVIAQREVRFGTGSDQLKLEAGSFEPAVARLMSMRPAAGRAFVEDEAAPGAPPVAMLGYGFWQRRFAGASDVVGQVITVDGKAHTIVGVVSPDFELPYFAAPPQAKEIWTPLVLPEASEGVSGIALLRRGATAAQAEREMTAIMRSNTADRFNESFEARALRPQDFLGPVTQDTLVVTLGAVAVLLLVACANVANLLLARAVSRRRELAIRTAVGAGRGRLIRQLLTESALLALAGGALGILVAWRGLDAIVALRPDNLAALDRVRLDQSLLLGSLGLSVLTGIVFGLAPAILATEKFMGDALKSGGRSGHRRSTRARTGLVTLEIALSVVLLVGAGLLVRSFRQLQQVEVGVDAAGLLGVSVTLPDGRYPTAGQRMVVLDEIRRRLELVPGVRSVTLASGLPGASGIAFGTLQIEGREMSESETVRSVGYNSVTPDFFRTVGLRLREGTMHSPDTSRYELIINASMAARYWPGRSAVGQRLRLTEVGGWSTVVGVVDDVRIPGATSSAATHQFYSRHSAYYDGGTFVLRVEEGTQDLVQRLTTQAESGGVATVYETEWMRDVIARRFVRPRFAMTLLSVFAGIALLVASVGLYGIIAYSVTRRTREMGIRIALGAQPASVMRLVVGEGARMGAVGVVLGLAAAAAGAGVMRNLVYGIAPVDATTFATAALVLGGIVLVGSWVPARRATRVNPLEAVRSE